MLSSLKIRNFRIYWLGMFVSVVGTWIQTVAQSWLIFELTNSVFLLGLVGFLSMFPIFILSLFGGVLADRADKRNILIITQSAFMTLAFILAVLTHRKLITPLEIMIIATLNGIVMAFDAPCRQSVIIELVGKKNLLNAVALSSAAFNSARIIGPALAGILIAGIGTSGCFYINGISFLAVILALVSIRVARQQKAAPKKHFLKELKDGLTFIRGHYIIRTLLLMVGITSLFGIPYVILMPAVARDVFGMGAQGLGILMSCVGLGALVAALTLARLGDFAHKGRILLASSIIFSLSLLAFSLNQVFVLSLVSLVFVGFSSVSAFSITNTLLQTLVPDNFRGRIMSGFMFTFAGILPFGNLISGSLASVWGVRMALFFNAIACLSLFSVIFLVHPDIKDL